MIIKPQELNCRMMKSGKKSVKKNKAPTKPSEIIKTHEQYHLDMIIQQKKKHMYKKKFNLKKKQILKDKIKKKQLLKKHEPLGYSSHLNHEIGIT